MSRRVSPLVDRFCALTRHGISDAPVAKPPSPLLPSAVSLPSADSLAFETDSTGQWNATIMSDVLMERSGDRRSQQGKLVPGFVSKMVECSVTGPMPQNKQLVIVLPVEKLDMEKGAVLEVARGVQWWERNTPIYVKVVNRGKTPASIPCGKPIARMIAVNTHDAERFSRLLNNSPLTSDRPSPQPSAEIQPRTGPSSEEPEPVDAVRASDANCGQLSAQQKE